MIQFKAKDASGEIFRSALTPFTFPAGEAHTKREDRRELADTEIAVLYGSTDMHSDLFQLAMWNSYLREMSPRVKRVLVLPYIPGARADRGLPLGVEVYTDFINELRLDQIIVFDPHSQKSVNLLRSRTITTVFPADLFDSPFAPANLSQYDGIIAPDKGAVLRASGVASSHGLPVFTATKTRNESTGKLSNFAVEGLPDDGKFLVVDDICDGGGTFMGLAVASGLGREQLHLYVSHGVFSGMALYNLPIHFARVYTTNSYAPDALINADHDYDYPVVVRSNVISLLLEKVK